MTRHACILVLLFASSLCVLQFGFHGFPWHMVGIKFLCTHEPIWLYNTTARADRDCEVDEMKMINRLSVILMRSYYEKRTKYSEIHIIFQVFFLDKRGSIYRISAYIQGTFDPSDRKRMFITIPSAAKAIVQSVTEELMYLSKKLRCAVIRITVLPGPETIYDLRVRNSSLSRGPSRGCKNKFAKLAPTSSGIYESKCQDILSRKIEQQLIIQGKEVPRNGHLR
uniref:Lipocalin n=1 Tax=Rhipicephalus appendiculatus TaxID=34631 RepID=A0A131Z2V7_RHIAP